MNIVVLCGGLSTERNVSFVSGSNVAKALRENGHKVIMLDVFMGYGDSEQALDASGLQAALDEAFSWEDTIVIEDYVGGREFSVGVIEGRALPIIEIAPVKGFYDYELHHWQQKSHCTLRWTSERRPHRLLPGRE